MIYGAFWTSFRAFESVKFCEQFRWNMELWLVTTWFLNSSKLCDQANSNDATQMWMDVRVLCPFNSISVISRRWKGDPKSEALTARPHGRFATLMCITTFPFLSLFCFRKVSDTNLVFFMKYHHAVRQVSYRQSQHGIYLLFIWLSCSFCIIFCGFF